MTHFAREGLKLLSNKFSITICVFFLLKEQDLRLMSVCKLCKKNHTIISFLICMSYISILHSSTHCVCFHISGTTDTLV